MKRAKIRPSKKTVYVFNIFRYTDKINGNTYKKFGECYKIVDGQRKYFKDWGYMIDKDFIPFYDYGHAYDTVKVWLNDNHGFNIGWMSEWPNIVAHETEVNRKFIGL